LRLGRVAPRRVHGGTSQRGACRGGLVPLPHTGCGEYSNGRATRPFRVKIVIWDQDASVEWNRASTERWYARPMPTPLTPPTLERVLQGLRESEIRCGIQNEPPADGITPDAVAVRLSQHQSGWSSGSRGPRSSRFRRKFHRIGGTFCVCA